jgi:ParB family chromosome partitioning protein
MEQKIIEIPLDKIVPNKSQPREEFDKEKVQELAESILSNGLINAIKVRKNGGNYIIVAGERRWKACKVAGFKTIQAIVKEYKDDGEWMLESFIENVQREDLNPLERAKYLKKIMDVKKFTTAKELSEFTKISTSTIADAFDVLDYKEDVKRLKLSQTQVVETRGLSDVDRKKVMEKASKEDIGNRTLREVVKTVKAAPDDVKKAFLKDEINVKQAQAISRLKDPKQRERAIKEHKAIASVDTSIETHIEKNMTGKEKKEFDKRLIQARNWIASFRGAVTDTNTSIEKTMKVLMIATKFVPLMDDKEKETLEHHLDRFLERLNRATEISEKIQEMI